MKKTILLVDDQREVLLGIRELKEYLNANGVEMRL